MCRLLLSLLLLSHPSAFGTQAQPSQCAFLLRAQQGRVGSSGGQKSLHTPPIAASCQQDGEEESEPRGQPWKDGLCCESSLRYALSAFDSPVADTKTRRRTLLAALVAATTTVSQVDDQKALAAPPIAVISEQLGYFPVTNAQGNVVYVPKRVQRASSDQALEVAQRLRDAGAVVYTAYWCPHCARQKEVLGQQAWQLLRNVECTPPGYQAQPGVCRAQGIDGFPTWILGTGQQQRRLSGEQSMEQLAKAVGYDAFDPSLEVNVPPLLGSSACK